MLTPRHPPCRVSHARNARPSTRVQENPMASNDPDRQRPTKQQGDQNDPPPQREHGHRDGAPSTPSLRGPTGRPERPIADVDRKVRGGDA